jgi:3-oxoadipate enol-lactonase
MPCLAVNGVDLYYEDRGSGSALLLVAGLASDSQSWPLVLPGLAARHRVITLDNRGAGRSTPPDGPLGIAGMADDCAALLHGLGVERAHVVGHSLGGFVAQSLAARHPQRVAKLVLAATAARSSARDAALFTDMAAAFEAGEDPARWYRNFFYWLFTPQFFAERTRVDAAIAWALGYPWAPPAASFRRQVNALATFDGRDGLARIAAPTLVLAGAQDLLFPVPECEAFARAIPGARFAVVADAAHAIHAEQPEAFNRRVLEFLAA